MFQRPIQPQGGRKGKKSFHTLCYMVCKGKFTFNTLVYLTVYHHFPFLPTCPSSSTALSSCFAFSRSHSFTFYPLSLPHFGTHQSSLGNALTHQHSNSHLLAWLDLSQLSEQIRWAGSHVNCGNMGYTGRSRMSPFSSTEPVYQFELLTKFHHERIPSKQQNITKRIHFRLRWK